MTPEHLDVIVVGAGLSGIDAGWHLKHRLPGRTFALLESRDEIGGTWSLFRYPGIRSDSDMFTFGYGWRPWPDARAIADGPSILAYLRDAVREAGLEPHLRFGHRVVGLSWSSADARWTVEVERGGARATMTAGFVLMCAGYYDPERGHDPPFPGRERFGGRIVHPQAWPDDLDWRGRRVVVIGSGATAVTLVPAMAKDAAHVTMLQRSPTWILSLPGEDPIARLLGRVLPPRWRHAAVRWKNVRIGRAVFAACRRWPDRVGAKLLEWARRQLPPGYPVERDFRPRYRPWEQRLCLVPDGDFFKAIRAGRASVVTDHVEAFDEAGLRLRSGARLDADVIVTATGLELKLLAGIVPVVDGVPVTPASALPYRGIMLSGVPNLAMVFGYTNASWTLRADLVCDWTCRVIAHMERVGATWAVPRPRPGDVGTEPFVDFSSGYFQRAMDRLPKQSKEAPWRAEQNYLLERRTLGRGELDDGVLRFEGAREGAAARRVETATAA
ncbi:MAG: NAD(P)/FAD-dependent oxidoreductase [Burkholderiaceae bacterium]|nr:NAD(P)/FAD-dependent oxidoreductase [Burkholderiales bacterium]MCZ8109135.1 NAD(P)/FAD-dependent oxidoreductase [Burkholderiales bacterium]MCZ8339437.1 NAD(P)/FAD-dependent oxidoreductase [Burkholderiaceae bacterium]